MLVFSSNHPCAHHLTGIQHGRVVLKKAPTNPLFPLDSLRLSSHWPAIDAAIKRGETLFCRGGAATRLFYKTQPCSGTLYQTEKVGQRSCTCRNYVIESSLPSTFHLLSLTLTAGVCVDAGEGDEKPTETYQLLKVTSDS